MIYFVLIFIFACASDFFYLLPAYRIHGVFNINDVGNALIWIALFYYIANTKRHQYLFNKVSLLIILYIFLVMVHVAIATVNYDQSVISGLIKSRHQFYYLSYFLFLMALDTDEKAERFMKIMTWVAGFVIIVSLINYAGVGVFHEHKWAEGQGERSGITRAFIPAMNIIAMMYVWYMAQIVYENKFITKKGLGTLFYFAGLLFRQTRGRIIAAVGVTVWALLRTGRIKLAIMLFAAVSIIGISLSVFTEGNLLVNTFTSAYTNVTEVEGSWRGRSETLAHSMEMFMEDPILGSGALLIRREFGTDKDRADAYQADLGWVNWLKDFGLAGIVWYLSLMWVLWGYIKKQRSSGQDNMLTRFGEFQFAHITISMATINYLVKPDGIIVFCLALAMITRPLIDYGTKSNTKQKSAPTNLLR